MSIKENKALVSRLYDAFDNGDLSHFSEFVDSKFVARVLGTTTLDWAGFQNFGALFRSAFPDGRHVFEHIVADEENVVTIGWYQGTHMGELDHMPATNLELRLPVMHLDRVKNGKLVEHRGLANERDLAQQLSANDAG